MALINTAIRNAKPSEKNRKRYDERFYRMWMFYLSGATAAFEWGGMGNYQIQFARNRRALPLTRGYIEAEERRLLGN